MTKVLEKNGDDNIYHSYIPPTFLDTKNSNLSNLDTKFILYKSQTRQQTKLPPGFEYTAWLITAFLSE